MSLRVAGSRRSLQVGCGSRWWATFSLRVALCGSVAGHIVAGQALRVGCGLRVGAEVPTPVVLRGEQLRAHLTSSCRQPTRASCYLLNGGLLNLSAQVSSDVTVVCAESGEEAVSLAQCFLAVKAETAAQEPFFKTAGLISESMSFGPCASFPRVDVQIRLVDVFGGSMSDSTNSRISGALRTAPLQALLDHGRRRAPRSFFTK